MHTAIARDNNDDAAAKEEMAGRTQRHPVLVLTRSSIRPSGDAGAAPASICRHASYGGLRVKRQPPPLNYTRRLHGPFPVNGSDGALPAGIRG
jgi:hypothetical protein